MPKPRATASVVFVAAVSALAALVVLAVGAQSAMATHSVGGFIGGTGGAAGEFVQPRDVAYYRGTDGDPATDKVFVVEGFGDGQRVNRLDRHGNFERMWGRDVVAGNGEFRGEICTVAELEACQAGAADAAGPQAGEFSNARGIAVNQATGDVYVWDTGNARVQQFDNDGNFIRAWGWGVVDGSSAFQVCEAPADLPCQAGVTGSGVGQFGVDSVTSTASPSNGIALDPNSGQVYVVDPGNGRFQRFEADGSAPEAIGAGEFAPADEQPRSIAVDGDGIVYASDAESSAEIERYDSSGATFLAPIGSGPLLSGGSGTSAQRATAGLEVDPATGNLFVLRDPSSGATVVQELADPGGTPAEVGSSPHGAAVGLQSSLNGFGHNPVTGEFYVADGSFDPGHGLMVLTESPGALTDVTVAAPAAIGAESVTLQGTVDANGGVASARFEVSVDGQDFTVVGLEGYVSGSGPVTVSAEVGGLDPNTPYRVRLSATKQTGLSSSTTVVSGEDTFMTDSVAPEAQTLSAASVRSSSAVLQARVDPNGATTTYYFEYGTTLGFGGRVPAVDASAGAGGAPRLVAEHVTGLQPGTTYHYRVVAESPYGLVEGDARSFTTRQVAAAPEGRAFELVSPADKIGGQGVGFYAPGDVGAANPGRASAAGGRYLVEGYSGSVLLDGAFSYASDWAFAERGASGWASHSPFTRPNFAPAYARFANLAAYSDGFELMVWASAPSGLSVFPELEHWWNMVGFPVLGDWRGRYEVLVPTHPSQGSGLASGGGGVQVVSGDGSHAAIVSAARGLNTDDPLGPDGLFDPDDLGDDVPFDESDPTNDQAPGTATLYIDDVSGGLSDTFPGEGRRDPVGVCDAGTEIPTVDGAGKLAGGPCAPPVEYEPGAFRDAALIDPRSTALGAMSDGAISEDGSRLFFTTPTSVDGRVISSPCTGTGDATRCASQLYVRHKGEDGTVSTRWISRPQVAGQDASLLGPAYFEGATPDGDKVYFRTASPLTADDPNGDCGAPCTTGGLDDDSWDLYEYDFTDDPGDDPGAGTLTRISGGPGGGQDPQASAASAYSLRFVSDDGNRVYFATAAPLAGALERESGNVTVPGGDVATTAASNLYLYAPDRPAGERYEFVARLDRDGHDLNACASAGGGAAGPITRDAVGENMQIPNPSNIGNCVRGSDDGEVISFLTATRLVADDPDGSSGDVYAFDAGAGELVRVSEPQGGVGGLYDCAAGAPCHADIGLGRPSRRGVATDPESGIKSVYFHSKGRLTADDLDDEYDVYAWRAGELSLVSTGTSEPAYYTGASVDGRDVFLMTAEALSWQDEDAVRDIYTARRGSSGFAQPAEPQVCSVMAGGCHGAAPAPAPVAIDSDQPGGSNAAPDAADPQAALTVRRPGARARRRAARTGVVRLKVGAGERTVARLVARARMRGRGRRVVSRVVAVRRRVVLRRGAAVVGLRLNRVAQRRLRRGARLVLAVRVNPRGGSPETVKFALRRAGR